MLGKAAVCTSRLPGTLGFKLANGARQLLCFGVDARCLGERWISHLSQKQLYSRLPGGGGFHPSLSSAKFTQFRFNLQQKNSTGFDAIFEAVGIEVLKLLPEVPNLNTIWSAGTDR